MKVFSNLRFLNIDIDVVNNNESKANASILLRVSCSDLSPLGEAWLLSCCPFRFRSCWDVSVVF